MAKAYRNLENIFVKFVKNQKIYATIRLLSNYELYFL